MAEDRENLLPLPVTASRPAQSQSIFKTSAHPIALFFYLAFRTAALLTYLLGLLFTDDFVFLFVIIVLLLAFDFWTVKNVSGRLLCGLRWWNETGPDGESVWVFESADPQRQVNATDSKVFWIVLYSVPVLWLLLALVAIFRFQFFWLTIVVVALILNMANVLAFTRCDKDQKRKWATSAAVGALSGGTGGFGGRIVGAVMGRFFQ